MASTTRRPSTTDINNMKKDELKSLVKALLKDTSTTSQTGEDTDIKGMLQKILDEVSGSQQERAAMKQQIHVLQESNKTLNSAVMQHQRFLESMDAERRRHNLIVTGLPEDDTLSSADPADPEGEPIIANTDEEKVSAVLTFIGHADVSVTSCERLGKHEIDPIPGDNHRPRIRALKITVSKPLDTKAVLSDAKKLKGAKGVLGGIFIKKDIHPGVRREFKRLYDAEKAERAKPENQGRSVEYDKTQRTLSVDGIIVDQFQPSFFQ